MINSSSQTTGCHFMRTKRMITFIIWLYISVYSIKNLSYSLDSCIIIFWPTIITFTYYILTFYYISFAFLMQNLTLRRVLNYKMRNLLFQTMSVIPMRAKNVLNTKCWIRRHQMQFSYNNYPTIQQRRQNVWLFYLVIV